MRPDIVVRYADHADGIIDLHLPESGSGPLVVILHGGFWRSEWDRRHTRPQADALRREGYVVATPEYRRTGAGGGWPWTFDDVGRAVGDLPVLLDDLGVPVTTTTLLGHSAGGHLALWLASEGLPLDRVVALAPVGDLRDAYRRNLDGGAVRDLVGEPFDAADPPYASGMTLASRSWSCTAPRTHRSPSRTPSAGRPTTRTSTCGSSRARSTSASSNRRRGSGAGCWEHYRLTSPTREESLMRKALVVLAALGVSLGSPVVLPAEAAPALTIKVSTTKVEVGKPVRVSGKATNADPGDPIRVQVRKPGTLRWVTVKTVAATATRTYATRIKLSAPGDNKVRVKSGKLLSPALTVTAYAWLRLTRQSFFAATSSPWLSGTVVLGSTSYPDSIWSSGAGAWYFNLDRCNRLRYVAGRSDEEATVQGQFVVYTSTSHEGGGTTNASHPVTGNPISVLDAIPEDDTRLYLSLDDFVDGPVAALGTLEVRCAAASLPQMHVSDVIS